MKNENKKSIDQSKAINRELLEIDQISNKSFRSVPLALFSILFLGVGLGQIWRPIKILLLKEESNDVYGFIGYNLLELIVPGFFIFTVSLFILGLFDILLFLFIWNNNKRSWLLGLIIWFILTLEDLWSIFWIQREIQITNPTVANFLMDTFGIEHQNIGFFLTTQVWINFFDSLLTNAFISMLFLVLLVYSYLTQKSKPAI